MDINTVFTLYYRPLCLYATHDLHDIDNTEDVVQDCFVKFIETSEKCNVRVAWIFLVW